MHITLLRATIAIPDAHSIKEKRRVVQTLLALDPQVRAIVCSGYATNPVMSNHEHYGFKAVLRKPFGESQLKKVLNTVLSEA
ncbi:MAG: DUF503 family protein [Candidatus Marinimicrobia bacterium]|nr:DUF503 family protein [Candidatus Neomarinimicrobiota bacterium]